MIVYNVERGWFPMKNDAEAHRRSLKLPVDALATIRIDSREELAAFLNALMGLKADEPLPEPAVVERKVVERNYVEVPDFVPIFLAKELAKGKEIRWMKDDSPDPQIPEPRKPKERPS